MKLEQAVEGFMFQGFEIARAEWEDGDHVVLKPLFFEDLFQLVKVEGGIERPYEFTDEDKEATDWYSTNYMLGSKSVNNHSPVVH